LIQSDQVAATTLLGSATDEDRDSLMYRWMEVQTTLLDWTPVGPYGECPLALSPLSLSLGQHTLVLEVKDSKEATGTDEMILPSTTQLHRLHSQMETGSTHLEQRSSSRARHLILTEITSPISGLLERMLPVPAPFKALSTDIPSRFRTALSQVYP